MQIDWKIKNKPRNNILFKNNILFYDLCRRHDIKCQNGITFEVGRDCWGMHRAAIHSDACASRGLRVYAMRRHHRRVEIRSGTGGKSMAPTRPPCVWPCSRRSSARERFNSATRGGLELGGSLHPRLDGKGERGNSFDYCELDSSTYDSMIFNFFSKKYSSIYIQLYDKHNAELPNVKFLIWN